MNTTKTNEVEAADARLEELAQALAEVHEKTAATTAMLGVAVADDDDRQVASLRAELGKQDARRRELEAAVPVAQERLRAAQERAQAAYTAEEARKANAARRKRLEAARKLDAAWRALGRAFDEHAACEPGGTLEDRQTVAQRIARLHRTALYHWAPNLARLLGAPGVQVQHRQSLEDSEAGVISEFEVDDDAARR